MKGLSAKVLALLAVGAALAVNGVSMFRQQEQRSITPVSVSGILRNPHAVSGTRSQHLHFNIVMPTGETTPDLHTEEGLLFVKQIDGQQVDATYTRESGYVSQFHILTGPSGGYAYNEPDQRNPLGGIAFILIGVVLCIVGISQWAGNRTADHIENG
jgi:hypothetical protein